MGARPLFPYRMVQLGARSLRAGAHAFERPTPSNETEYRRKVRMFEHCWEITLRGAMFRRLPPGYLVEVVSHRLLRYGSGILHLIALLASSVALVSRRLGLRDRARRPGGADRRGGRRRADRALLRARHLGDGRRALELPAARRARDVGRGRRDAMNRALDAVASLVGLVVTSPLLAASAIAIKLEDGGPILFRQTRVGKDGRISSCSSSAPWSSMPRSRVPGMRSMPETAASRAWAASAPDIGRRAAPALEYLPRRDEPDRAATDVRYQVEKYTRASASASTVRPGLTGWAQINGRATLPWAERIELDVWYVEHRSPRVDLKILLAHPTGAVQRDVSWPDRRLEGLTIVLVVAGTTPGRGDIPCLARRRGHSAHERPRRLARPAVRGFRLPPAS